MSARVEPNVYVTLGPAELRIVDEVARSVARTVRHRVPSSDLASVGSLVLCDAVRTYDPSRCRFAPYLVDRLRWAMLSVARRELHRQRLLARNLGAPSATAPEESDAESPHDPLRDDEDPAAALERRRLHGHLVRELASLPDETRAVLIRHYFGGETLEEVARTTGRSKPTVTRIHRAGLALLCERLGAHRG